MTTAGVWENEYGSRMTLTVENNEITGIYESTTGSTGKYVVFGYQNPKEPTSSAGQPVALCIHWHSISDDPADASWNWTSALGGQINKIDGEDVLILAHLMVASSEFIGLTPKGTYVDKLTYRRVPANAETPSNISRPAPQAKHARITGDWVAQEGTVLSLNVTAIEEDKVGFVTGFIRFDNQTVPLTGVTDINTEEIGLRLQSTSLTAFLPDNNETLALGGVLRLDINQLDLQLLINRITAPASNYVQTEIRPLFFSPTTR